MKEYLQFALLGLGAGTLYAMLAQGMLLIYRGSGVINLAQGAMAMYIAYLYNDLRRGIFLIPPLPNPFALVQGVVGWFGYRLRLPSWPTTIRLGGSLGFWPSFTLAILVAAGLGLLLHFGIFRWIRNAPPLAKIVASLGIALMLQAIIALRFGAIGIPAKNSLPATVYHPLGTVVPEDRFLLLAIAASITVALAALSKHTRLGLSTRAAAENERGALMLGLSPDKLGALNWVLGAVLAGIAGILCAPLTGLDPESFVLFVIPALCALLVARFESFTVAALAALLIGILQSICVPLQSHYSWFPQYGADSAVPLLLIFVAMLFSGNRIPSRSTAGELRLPNFPRSEISLKAGASLFGLVFAGVVFLPFAYRAGLINSVVGVVLTLSLVVVIGLAGQISFMQLAIGGFVALAMTRLSGDWHIPFPFSPIIAVAVAALAGVIVGLPALRVRGVQLAVLTLAAAYVFEKMALDNPTILRPTDEANSVGRPSLGGLQFGIYAHFPFGARGVPSPAFGIFALLVATACLAGVVMLRRSRTGLGMLAMRGNERAAASVGVKIEKTKLIAFCIAAVLAGTAGVLSTYAYQGADPSSYSALTSISIVAVAYLGGVASLWGAVIGGVLVAGGLNQVVIQHLFHVGQFEALLVGIGLILTVVLNPEGIIGVLRTQLIWCKSRFSRLNIRGKGYPPAVRDPGVTVARYPPKQPELSRPQGRPAISSPAPLDQS
jgi:branched-chain amino acid transport system permease protein